MQCLFISLHFLYKSAVCHNLYFHYCVLMFDSFAYHLVVLVDPLPKTPAMPTLLGNSVKMCSLPNIDKETSLSERYLRLRSWINHDRLPRSRQTGCSRFQWLCGAKAQLGSTEEIRHATLLPLACHRRSLPAGQLPPPCHGDTRARSGQEVRACARARAWACEATHTRMRTCGEGESQNTDIIQANRAQQH